MKLVLKINEVDKGEGTLSLRCATCIVSHYGRKMYVSDLRTRQRWFPLPQRPQQRHTEIQLRCNFNTQHRSETSDTHQQTSHLRTQTRLRRRGQPETLTRRKHQDRQPEPDTQTACQPTSSPTTQHQQMTNLPTSQLCIQHLQLRRRHTGHKHQDREQTEHLNRHKHQNRRTEPGPQPASRPSATPTTSRSTKKRIQQPAKRTKQRWRPPPPASNVDAEVGYSLFMWMLLSIVTHTHLQVHSTIYLPLLPQYPIPTKHSTIHTPNYHSSLATPLNLTILPTSHSNRIYTLWPQTQPLLTPSITSTSTYPQLHNTSTSTYPPKFPAPPPKTSSPPSPTHPTPTHQQVSQKICTHHTKKTQNMQAQNFIQPKLTNLPPNNNLHNPHTYQPPTHKMQHKQGKHTKPTNLPAKLFRRNPLPLHALPLLLLATSIYLRRYPHIHASHLHSHLHHTYTYTHTLHLHPPILPTNPSKPNLTACHPPDTHILDQWRLRKANNLDNTDTHPQLTLTHILQDTTTTPRSKNPMPTQVCRILCPNPMHTQVCRIQCQFTTTPTSQLPHSQLQKLQQSTHSHIFLPRAHITRPHTSHISLTHTSHTFPTSHTMHPHASLNSALTSAPTSGMAPSEDVSMSQARPAPPADNPRLEITLRSKSKSNKTSEPDGRSSLRRSRDIEGALKPSSRQNEGGVGNGTRQASANGQGDEDDGQQLLQGHSKQSLQQVTFCSKGVERRPNIEEPAPTRSSKGQPSKPESKARGGGRRRAIINDYSEDEEGDRVSHQVNQPPPPLMKGKALPFHDSDIDMQLVDVSPEHGGVSSNSRYQTRTSRPPLTKPPSFDSTPSTSVKGPPLRVVPKPKEGNHIRYP